MRASTFKRRNREKRARFWDDVQERLDDERERPVDIFSSLTSRKAKLKSERQEGDQSEKNSL